MEFLGMGWFEILIVALVALIVLGPERLPAYARKAGRFIRQFRKITSGVSKEVSKAMDLDSLLEDEEEGDTGIRKELKAITKSLEEDAAELRRSLSEEAELVEKTVRESATEASRSLSKGAADIQGSLSAGVSSAGKELSAGLKEARESLGMSEGSAQEVVAYSPPAESIPEG